MGSVSEIDVLKIIESALSSLEDKEARNRILEWAWNKFSSNAAPAVKDDDSEVAQSLDV